MELREYVDSYFKFMWNKWDENTCYQLFEPLRLSEHIWNKWCNTCETDGCFSAPASFWPALDDICQNIIANAAVAYYYNK